MRKNKILITGGAGFIGSHLVERLTDHYEVVVLDNYSAGNKISPCLFEKITFIDGDVRHYDTVLKAAKGCDTIIHLSAIVGVDRVIERRIETIEVEALGTQNIGKAAQFHNIKRIIYASSSAVYKNTKEVFSYEADELDLVNDYAVAKRLNELYFESLNQESDISCVSFRFFNVYGLNQDTRMVIPRFFQQAFSGNPIEVFGDGMQTRDFTYVYDVTKAIRKLIEKPTISGIFNIARGTETTILELAQHIKAAANSSSSIQLLEFPEKRASYKVDRRVGSPDKLFDHIGYKPITTLAQGLTDYVDLMRDKLGKAV